MDRKVNHASHLPQIREIFKLGFDDYACVLQRCTKKQDLVIGRKCHAGMVIDDMKHLILNNILINMYAKSGSIDDAWCVFVRMHEKDVFSWTNMISGYVNNGFPSQALTLFGKMGPECTEPNNATFSCLLKGCSILGSLHIGRLIHEYVLEISSGIHIFAGSALIDMYAKCGSIHDAYEVFNQMQCRNIVSWSTMISGFVEYKQCDFATMLFSDMLLQGSQPNEVTFISILKGTALMLNLEQGRYLHCLSIETGHHKDIFVEANIIDMYAKCGSLVDAHEVFCKMAEHNVVTFSTMISAYIDSGEVVEALKLFEEMRAKKLNPDKITFVSMLTGLAMLGDLEEGKRMHDLIRIYEYESDKSVANALLDMYAKCKSVENVQEVFDHLEDRDTVSWSCVIAAHAECNNHGKQALDYFDRMMCEGILPISYTFVGVFKACIAFGNVAQGKRIHSVVIDTEHEHNTFIASSLINMYAKCDEVAMAEQAFGRTSKQNLAAWNAVIAGFLQPDLAAKAFMVFQQMKLEGMWANAITVASLLKACSMLQDVELGQKLHLFAVYNELEPDTHVQNRLIDMYAKCGRLGMAECVFGGSPRRNVSTWNGMISSYVQFKRPEDALSLFQRMGEECIAADEATFSALFKACACLAALQRGCRLHTLAREEESECLRDPDLCSSMISMYAKSGDIRSARAVFFDCAMPDPSLFAWNAMITCYAQHGKAEEALQLWQDMGRKPIAPNRITFLAVLAACGHGGRMEEGKACYLSMVGVVESHHHLVAEHLVCMVGLFGRAGQLESAKDLIQEIIPYESALTMAWRTVLRACSFHGDSALLSSIIGELEAELIAAD